MGKVIKSQPPKLAEDLRTDRAAVLASLMAADNKPERAGLYVDAYLEYHEAQGKIRENGSIVADPRTGAPIPNPYLAVLDKAFARLTLLHRTVRASSLW